MEKEVHGRKHGLQLHSAVFVPVFWWFRVTKTAGLIHHTERGATDNDEPQQKRRCEKHGKRF